MEISRDKWNFLEQIVKGIQINIDNVSDVECSKLEENWHVSWAAAGRDKGIAKMLLFLCICLYQRRDREWRTGIMRQLLISGNHFKGVCKTESWKDVVASVTKRNRKKPVNCFFHFLTKATSQRMYEVVFIIKKKVLENHLNQTPVRNCGIGHEIVTMGC